VDDKKDQTTEETTQQQTEKIRQWVSSTEGQAAIVAALQRAHEQAARFREAERIDPASLLKPFTI